MRRVRFCAGHRLYGHEGKCAHFHGHNYLAEFHVAGTRQDAVGRVIDFSELKNALKGWIDEHWDHGFLLSQRDENGLNAIRQVEPSRYYVMPDNPTAENMAQHLLTEVCPGLLEPLGVHGLESRHLGKRRRLRHRQHQSSPGTGRGRVRQRGESRFPMRTPPGTTNRLCDNLDLENAPR